MRSAVKQVSTCTDQESFETVVQAASVPVCQPSKADRLGIVFGRACAVTSSVPQNWTTLSRRAGTGGFITVWQ